jgi:hypothetical protein
MQENKKRLLSFTGRLFYNLGKICSNFKLFIGEHERTIEIIFLTIFFLLQGFLALYLRNPYVTLIVIIFLFFLALERIFVHIWLDYERLQLKEEEDKLGKDYYELRNISYLEQAKLKNEINNLKNKLKH